MVDVLLGKKQEAVNLIEDFQADLYEMKEKAWLLHTALFVSFPETPIFYYELCSINKFSNTIEVGTPHLFRYFLAAVLIKKPTKVLETVQKYFSILHKDQALLFLVKLLDTFDFEAVFNLLADFSSEMVKDYFLESLSGKLIYEAKKFLVFCYLKLNLRVEASWVHEKTGEDAKKIVEEIQNDHQLRFSFDGKYYQKAQHKPLAQEKIHNFTELLAQSQKFLSK